jgi:hypothetical protein
VAQAITSTNDQISAKYNGMAMALRDPTSSDSQTLLSSAKAAAAISQANLLTTLNAGSSSNYAGVSDYINNLSQLISKAANSFQEVAALSSSNASTTDATSNPVLQVSQALSDTGTNAQLKDISGNFSQISLAKMLALNVNSVTLLGTSSSVTLALTGNNINTYDLSKLASGTFNQSYTVTLKVADADVPNLVAAATQLSAAG